MTLNFFQTFDSNIWQVGNEIKGSKIYQDKNNRWTGIVYSPNHRMWLCWHDTKEEAIEEVDAILTNWGILGID